MFLRRIRGFLFVGLSGTLLHFAYERFPATALFSAINESVWEHMKLLFYPWLVYGLIQSRKASVGFWWVKLAGIATGLILIPVLYYTYTGALGLSADWFNIAIFFLATGATFLMEHRLQNRSFCPLPQWPAVVMILLFTVFTFYPPHFPLFQDPVTGLYGL